MLCGSGSLVGAEALQWAKADDIFNLLIGIR
jgi:hypothetical protein